MFPYEPPAASKEAYNCPHCHAYAKQVRSGVLFLATNMQLPSHTAHQCAHCGQYMIWHGGTLVFPPELPALPAAADMPADVRADYEEARAILVASPRGAAALLRLALQKLVAHLGQSDRDLNAAIAELVRAGLPIRVQQALDVLRVVGNNAVHPGQIDLRDDRDMAQALFGLINLITDVMITQPAAIDRLYGSLPEGARAAIGRRDRKAPDESGSE